MCLIVTVRTSFDSRLETPVAPALVYVHSTSTQQPPSSVVAVAVVGHVVVDAVDGEGDAGGSQAGEGALESVEAGELALVPPGLSVTLSDPDGKSRLLPSKSLTLSPKDHIWACRSMP